MKKHIEHPYCETCGESPAEIRLARVSLCGDCFAVAFQEQVKGLLWSEPCGHPYFDSAGRCVAICAEPCGTEHDHCRHTFGRGD